MAEDKNSIPNQENLPEAEVLETREDDTSSETEESDEAKKESTKVTPRKTSLRSRYRLSHRATFLGLVAAIVVLLIVGVGVAFVIRGQSEDEDGVGDQVVISQAVLEGLGVNRTAVADEGAELIVGPNARFDKRVQVGGDVSVGGELILNSRLTASDASLNNLQAGDVSFEELNINGDSTVSNLSIRQDLTVAGSSRLQGTTTIGGQLSVDSNLVVAGNVTVSGVLTVGTFQANSLTATNGLTVGGRIISTGSAPSASAGPAAGSNGTVSISGNDIAGTVGVNVGVGGGNGTVANITFNTKYPVTPRVVVSPIGNVGSFYIFRTSSGFSIGVGNSLSPGGYAFDYIVVQ